MYQKKRERENREGENKDTFPPCKREGKKVAYFWREDPGSPLIICHYTMG